MAPLSKSQKLLLLDLLDRPAPPVGRRHMVVPGGLGRSAKALARRGLVKLTYSAGAHRYYDELTMAAAVSDTRLRKALEE